MKRIISTVLLAAITLTASAQQYMRIWANGDNERVALQDLTFSNNGASVKVGETTYATAQIDSIRMVYVISVAFNGSTATVDLRNAPGVSYTTNGANVNIVSENTTDELEIELSGSSSNGSLTYTGGYKCKFYLQGLNLTSTTGAPLDIQCGKRVDLILVGGTTNTLTDATNGEQKACLYCKGHLEISGGGSLNVKGNTRHAIATKEYLQLKKSTGTITVTKAAGDAIHAGQYFQMNGGTLNLSGMTGDGIQAEMTNDPTEEYNGFVFIKGGNITMTLTSPDVKGIKSDSTMIVSGGSINIATSGAGSKGITASYMTINENDASTVIIIRATGGVYTDPVTKETSKCMGIKVTNDLTISAGSVTVTNTGSQSKSIKVGGTYYAKGGTVKTTTAIDYEAIVK